MNGGKDGVEAMARGGALWLPTAFGCCGAKKPDHVSMADSPIRCPGYSTDAGSRLCSHRDQLPVHHWQACVNTSAGLEGNDGCFCSVECFAHNRFPIGTPVEVKWEGEHLRAVVKEYSGQEKQGEILSIHSLCPDEHSSAR